MPLTAKPNIHVNQNSIMFNITGSLVVEGVQFSGLNQLAFSTDYDLSTASRLLCELAEPINTNGVL